jgi:hypothetical protein
MSEFSPFDLGSGGSIVLTHPIIAGASREILVPVAVVSILVFALEESCLWLAPRLNGP